jgi:FeS assembly SUF system regulator
MLRLSKMADYGIVLLSYIANEPSDDPANARCLAQMSGLPLPTVSKVLKGFSRAGLLIAHRGQQGGYSLARHATKISVAEMITAIDGPIGLTDCSRDAPHLCDIEATCPVRNNWNIITHKVQNALAELSLEQMAQSHSKRGSSRPPRRLELLK